MSGAAGGTKRCRGCGNEKLRSEFSKDRSARDGLMGACKACDAARAIAWRAANPDTSKSYRGENNQIVRTVRKTEHDIAHAIRTTQALQERIAVLETLVRQSGLRTLNSAIQVLQARVAVLETLARPSSRSRQRKTAEVATSVVPAETMPVIRTIQAIIAEDNVKPAEAKRIQTREILARATWKPNQT